MDLVDTSHIPVNPFQGVKDGLRRLYVDDPRPWLEGFSGGKDSTMLASLVFDTVQSVPSELRKKPVSVLRTDTRVEIRAIAGMMEGALEPMGGAPNRTGLSVRLDSDEANTC